MKYLGDVCRVEPEHGNERYRFKHHTVCVQCHILRTFKYKTLSQTPLARAARKKRSDRYKSAKSRKYMAAYKRCYYLDRKARTCAPEVYDKWREQYALALRITDMQERHTFLRHHFDLIVAPALPVV